MTAPWSPIGSITAPFTGVFDGDGFAVKGFTANVSEANAFAGLFGYSSGTIKNVTVEMAAAGMSVAARESAYVGAIVAYNNKGSVTGCHVDGDIKITATTTKNTSNVYAGLIAGKSTGEISESNASGSLVVNSSATDGDDTTSDPVQVFAGGLIGLSSADQKNNFAIVDVDVTAVSATGYSAPVIKAGGIAGENTGSIVSTYAVGNISAETSASASDSAVYAGGLIGKNSGTIERTNASGNVTAKTDAISARTYAGGLIGYSTGDVSESYASGLAQAETTTDKDVVYAGGLVGFGSGLISKTYATGKATAESQGALALQGGLVGYTSVAAVDSYYKKDSGYSQMVGCGTAKTEEELKSLNTYAGWDFSKIWKISGNYNNGYPYLVELSAVEIVFQDAEYNYDGTEKEIVATGITSGMTVEYVNNKASNAGVYNAVAIVTAPGYGKTVATAKLTINKKKLTITGLKVEDKDFDNTTEAVVDASKIAYEGIIPGDDVRIDETKTVARFATKNVGENIEVEISKFVLAGADAENYYCDPCTTTANIFDGDYSDVILEGLGTPDSPYLISDVGELNAIRGKLGANFKLTSDIVLTEEWVPIGRIGRAFAGTLDGNGFTISGLRVSKETNYTYSGLFGYSEGKISNLNVVAADDLYTTANNSYIGAIAGYNVGTISNCTVSGSIKSNLTSSFVYVGGIAGYNVGTITYSEAAAGINAYGSTVYAGGVVGENAGIIENTGAVADVNVEGALFAYAGGFAGNSILTIRNCYTTANVSINVTNTGFAANAAGFAGRLEGGSVANSYAAGKPQIVVAPGAYLLQKELGGFTAYNAASVSSNYYDSTVSGLADANVASPKSTSEMQNLSTFEGWNTELWRISENRNGGYPYIKKFYTLSDNAKLSYDVDTKTISVEAYTGIENAYLVVLSYNVGKLVDYDIIKPINIAEGDIIEKPVKAGFVTKEGGSVKVMLWENMNTIRPLCGAKEVPIR